MEQLFPLGHFVVILQLQLRLLLIIILLLNIQILIIWRFIIRSIWLERVWNFILYFYSHLIWYGIFQKLCLNVLDNRIDLAIIFYAIDKIRDFSCMHIRKSFRVIFNINSLVVIKFSIIWVISTFFFTVIFQKLFTRVLIFLN